LESVRYYTEAHAVERSELADLRGRHLDHYVAAAEAAFSAWLHDYTAGRVMFDREWDNLRSSARHGVAVRASQLLDRLFAAVDWHSVYMLRFEVFDWAVEATSLPGAGTAAFGAAAFLGAFVGRIDDAERFARAGIAAASHPEAPETFTCWLGLMLTATSNQEPERFHEAVVAARQTGALDTIGKALIFAVTAAHDATIAPSEAADLAERAERLIAGRDHPARSADILSNLAVYYSRAGDPARGIEHCLEAISLARDCEALVSVHTARMLLVRLAVMGGQDDLLTVVHEALADARRDGAWVHVWTMVAAIAGWWANHGRLDAAAVAIGYLNTHELGTFSDDATHATIAAVSSHPDAVKSLEQGQRLDRDEVVAFVLTNTAPTSTVAPSSESICPSP
jgi:hypothetical protein